MADSTVVLITGVTRGIGKALLKSYLSRPNYVVIGSVRDKTSPAAQDLKTLPTAAGTRLLLVKIENTSATDPFEGVKEIEAAGIDHLDTVIANAGGGGSKPMLEPVESVTVEGLEESFGINTLGPVLLFQAVRPLLQKSEKSPRFVPVSSAAGSIGLIEAAGSHVVAAYGIAKAGLNWFTVAAHAGNKWLIAFALHPGFVQSDSGNTVARQMGMEKAPVTLEQCISAITGLIDLSTRESSSGKFFDVMEGRELPW